MERLPLRSMLAITLLALAVRLAFFSLYRFEGMDCDGAAYLEVARHLASGRGYVTDAHRFLFLPVTSFPQPDVLWSPLYPHLTALSFALFGETFTAAKLVPLAFGALVPALTCLLANVVTGRARAARVAGLLAAVHPTLVTWSLRIETEIATLALVPAALALAFTIRGRLGAVGLGAVLGLAWLLKYQNGSLLPPVLLALFLRMPARRAIRHVAIAGLALLVTISPWLLRNVVEFGHPLHTGLQFSPLSNYREFGGEPRFLTSLERPPDALSWLAAHPEELLRHTRSSIHHLRLQLVEARVVAPPLLLLAIAGLVPLVRRWRVALPLGLYATILVAAFAATVPHARYLFSLIPLGLTAAGAGGTWLLDRALGGSRTTPSAGAREGPKGRWRPLLAVLVLIGVVWTGVVMARDTLAIARDRETEWTPAAAFCALEAQAARGWIEANLGPREPLLATEVYHAAYLFARPAIQVPFDDSTLAVVSERFGARTMFLSLRELRRRLPHWERSTPPWAQLVLTIPPERIRAPAPWYAPVTEVRIYRLDPARVAGGAPGAK